MEENRTVIKKRDVAWVVSSNVLTLFTAIAIGLVMPRFVSYETYAGYRTYTLYIGFAYLFHLGIVNGVALRFGGTDYRNLPFERFRSYTLSLIILQLVWQVLLFGIYVAATVLTGSHFEITPIVFVIINLLQANMRHYFSMTDRFSGRFKTDAALLVFYDVATILGYGVLLLSGTDSFISFLFYTTTLNVVLLILYASFNRSMVFGPLGKEISKEDILLNIKRGGYVMLGELIGTLILGADSIFAQLFFDVKSFSEYSFAVYIIVSAYTMLSAADNLIFPYLKRLGSEKKQESYVKLKRVAIWLSALMMAMLFACRPLIALLMPAYNGSVPILMILGGTLLLRALQGLACGNFFRALDMEREYFANNILACILAVTTDAAAFIIFGDLRFIAAASVLVYGIWFVISDLRISKKLGEKVDVPGYIMMAAILAMFYFAAFNLA